ncbi:MAG TPA: ATP-binding protein [Steroidobacteraceae bacterium]|jgi:signal transduction histidine kinase
MARHFLQLYLLIVATLAVASWGQERLWQQSEVADKPAQTAVLALIEEQLHTVPREDRPRYIAKLAPQAGGDLELFDMRDIAGDDTLARLARGEPALMSAEDGRAWLLKRLADDGRILAFKYAVPDTRRGLVDWLLALLFYAAIALVIMTWLWPLTRDLRRLERATTTFGNRNWTFDAPIKPGSPVQPLAAAFRRMAARIDSLISSHKDMSNAVSHEIKTPLARMRFEIEMARTAASPARLAEHMNNLNTDIAELNAFVTATLDYAILERAEVALNIAAHDFTLILPAVTESVRRSARPELTIQCEVHSNATHVVCDAHLIETVLRNLLYNAMRYAQHEIRVTFAVSKPASYSLHVDDDGPGIAEADRQRVFGSFVQLDSSSSAQGNARTGYGLGLAIVKRVVEWHEGSVTVSQSPLGGARFAIQWSGDLPTSGGQLRPDT